MRLPVPQERGLETAGGVAVIAAFVAVPTGLPLSEMFAELLPALPAGSAAPLLIMAIWASLFAWFWAGISAHLARSRPDRDR